MTASEVNIYLNIIAIVLLLVASAVGILVLSRVTKLLDIFDDYVGRNDARGKRIEERVDKLNR